MTELRRRARATGDDRLFGPDARPGLRSAVADLSWLLTRGYSSDAALKLVGDKHALSARQRMAVLRSACSDEARERRRAARVELADLAGVDLAIDGLNALITVESALSHGVVLRGRDGALRDLAAVHGAYEQVLETSFAVDAIARLLHGRGARPPAQVVWYLDRPVAGSGRLRALLEARAREHELPWTVQLVHHPDPILAQHAGVIATSDAWILDRCARWIDLLGALLRGPTESTHALPLEGPVLAARPDLWLLDLSDDTAPHADVR
ncbi:DUF434 domain-containing protein [Nannocystis sp. SCPEA4]|uniref:DUF434 domain-containing protein n=1 Tax=Nannocystis sp. SCPEA4 TaxID=2996787 RepID=UPI002272218E|nr:DUF434 domain-containing protein [Nannocystis sp. SCPEA4]MCY1054374.1 DUF434 domain-containing protein [Nannocystis sp. SCPEA4]